MRGEIPDSWQYISLDNVVLKGKGKKPKKLLNEKKDGMVPYIDIKAFEKGIIEQYADTESSKIINENDVLVVWDGARFGLSGFGMKGAAGSTLMALTPVLVHCRYLYFFINRYYEYINSHPKGTGTPHVNPDIFWNLEFPLPPLNEQEHIATKLDKIMLKINCVKDRLERISKIIKRCRQSVLNAAVTGKLTEKWRDEHPDVEKAEVLIERILKEREIEYQKECERAKREGSRRPKQFKVNRDLFKVDIEVSNWTWERLVNIAEISGGVTKGRKLNNSDCLRLPYLRVANVQDGYLDLTVIKKIEIKKNEKEKYLLKSGDVLFTEGGDRDKLGRGTVWSNEIENCIHQNHVFKARVNSNYLLPDYISLVTKSDYSKKYFVRVASQTVNLASINMTNLGDLPIPVCPFLEQHEIVRQVDKLFSFADKLEAHHKKAKENLDKLSQSVLAKAFRGELVSQDPRDEPAEELLERIKEEKIRLEIEMKKIRRNSARAHK